MRISNYAAPAAIRQATDPLAGARRSAAANNAPASTAGTGTSKPFATGVADAALSLRWAQDAVDAPLRTNAALSIADSALGQIQGLLDQVQQGISSSSANATTRVDQAIAGIDYVAASASFDGQALLDGTFTTQSGNMVLALGAFSSDKLGDSGADTLASLASGQHKNDGETSDDANAIIAGATAQVAAARSQIAGFQASALRPMIASTLASLGRQPTSAAPIYDAQAAQTTSLLARAQVALNPDMLAQAASGDPQPQQVLALIG